MNARQKAKHYKKKYNELYKACVLHVAAENIEREIREASVIDICGVRRHPRTDTRIGLSDDYIIRDMFRTMTKSDEFKQSVAIEKWVDPLTDEIVYRAHLQTIRPKMEE